jgi:hypothetical protein
MRCVTSAGLRPAQVTDPQTVRVALQMLTSVIECFTLLIGMYKIVCDVLQMNTAPRERGGFYFLEDSWAAWNISVKYPTNFLLSISVKLQLPA